MKGTKESNPPNHSTQPQQKCKLIFNPPYWCNYTTHSPIYTFSQMTCLALFSFSGNYKQYLAACDFHFLRQFFFPLTEHTYSRDLFCKQLIACIEISRSFSAYLSFYIAAPVFSHRFSDPNRFTVPPKRSGPFMNPPPRALLPCGCPLPLCTLALLSLCSLNPLPPCALAPLPLCTLAPLYEPRPSRIPSLRCNPSPPDKRTP